MKKLFATLFCALVVLGANAQLNVFSGFTAQQLATHLAGPNITVTNPSVTGANVQYGKFTFTGTGFPLNDGIILTTGSIFDAPGPNSSGGTSTNNNGPGNSLLTTLAGVQTYDAVVFEIDFTVQSDMIEFRYLFASEEYNEYVGSGFNDVFAFFISGPGITGMENLAVVPNTNVPVTINNINLSSYWQYYNDNENGTTNLEFDGYTSVLTAKKTGLIPCSTYTLTMMIADAGDGIFDAAVFLQANSLIQGNVSASTSTFSGNNTALEGCIDASFTFQLDTVQSVPTYVNYSVGGSAVNGVDYGHIDNLLVIPAGQTSATIIIDALSDGMPEGTESVELYFSPAPCAPLDTVFLYISDYQTLQFTTIPSDLNCFQSGDGEIDFNITGGTPPYSVILTDTNTHISTTYTTLPITGLPAGTYHIRVLDGYGCYAEDIIAGGIFDADTTFLPDGNGVSYMSSITISGFGAGQTLQNINQLQAICMNMEHSFIGDLLIELQAPNGTTIELKPQPGGSKSNMGEPVATGQNDTQSEITTPGVGYDYCFNSNPDFGTMVSEANNHNYTYISQTGSLQSDTYLPAGSYTSAQPLTDLIGVPINGQWTLIVTDEIPNNNGYIFSWSISMAADLPDSIVTLTQPFMPAISGTQNNPTCGASTGSINMTVSGGVSPFSYLWSNGAITEDISNLGAGNYAVTVTDGNNCHYYQTFSLPNSSAAIISAIAGPQLCPGTNTGEINITVTGGTSPYSYLWSNGATSQDVVNLAPGTYSVQVTDQAGCISAASYTINPASTMYINATVTNEECGNMEGSIDLTIIGGASPLSYYWSNNAVTEDLNDLAQGTYTVTVTDNNDCDLSQSYTVTNLVGNCVPECDLIIQQATPVNEICGNANGSIQLTVFTTNLPYQVNWSNGSTQEDLSGLNAGTYTVTITDNESCVVTQTFTLTNQTGTLAIQGGSAVNETCGNGQGAVNITPGGGALPYTYVWSTGATTEDLTGLHSGTYAVTLTDANNCHVYGSYTVLNVTTGLNQTYGNALNAICGNNNGSIDITISGGQPPYTYNWSNGAHTQDLLNIGPGSYYCQIIDGSGCTLYTPTYQVLNESGTLAFNYIDADNEECGDGSGEIILSLTGGQLPYTYAWSTGASTSSLSNLSAGVYSCTVTDFSGCSILTGDITIVNQPGTLAVNNINTNDEICGNGLGSVQITVSGGSTPYTFQWNTGATTQNLWQLSAGTYTCTITDASGCSFVLNATVNNEAGSLEILNLVTANEICGNAAGSINLIMTGGTAPITYAWSGGYSTEDLSGLHAGTYTVTISDINGCQTMGSATITNQTGTLATSLNAITNEICGNNAGAVNINIMGGTPPYVFLWSNAATTEDITGIGAGTYTCTITDDNGCIVISGPHTVNNNSGGLLLSNAVISEALCASLSGAVNITTTGGTAPLSYLWSNAATTEDISGLSAGIYSVTITDVNGCEVHQTYTVPYSAGTLDLVSYSVTDELCGNNMGAIDITVSGGTTPYAYAWSNSASTQDLTGLSAGTYAVTVEDANGCEVTQSSITLIDNPGNFTLVSIIESDEVCNNNNGSINITLTGGANPISYLWSNGGFTQDQLHLNSGVYTCTATDNNGCVLVYTASIANDPGNLTVNAIVTPESCGQQDGAIDVTLAGGTNPFTYIWSNGATILDLLGIEGGTYILNVTDSVGCVLAETYVVAATEPIYILSTVVTDEVCNNSNGSIQVNIGGGTGNYTYDWESTGAPPCCTYELEVRDQGGNGWNGSSLDVNINGTLFGTFICAGFMNTYQIPVCEGDQIELDYTTGFQEMQNSYTLFDSDGNTVFIETAPPSGGISFSGTTHCSNPLPSGNYLSGLEAGDYELTVTDPNGCSISTTITVLSDNGTLGLGVPVIIEDTCGNGVGGINISVTGGTSPYSYTWNTGSSTQDIYGLFADTYTVTVMDANGCEYSQTYIVNMLSGDMSLAASNVTNTFCGDSSGGVDITIAGGIPPYSFLWSDGSSNEDLSNVEAGTYDVMITDAVGCQDLRTFVIQNLTNGLGVTVFIDAEYCSNGAGFIDLTITGGFPPYQIDWNTGDTTEDLTNLSAGTYSYVIIDSTGCEITGFAIIANNAGNLLLNSYNVTNENCGLDNGSINLTITGGTAPLAYDWSNGAITEDITGLNEGTYSVTVTDVNGCEITEDFLVNAYASFDIIDTIIVAATCDVCSDGSIFLSTWGFGGPPIGMTYLWSNGATSEDILSVLPGTYTVTATDGLGCERIETYTIPYDTTFGTAENDFAVFNLYPNPTDQIFTLSWDQSAAAAITLEIYNVLGEKILDAMLPMELRGNARIDLGNQPTGVYTLKLTSGNTSNYKRLIIRK